MFKVDDHIILDVQNQVDYRDIKYGRDDLGDLSKKIVWTEPLDSFMEVCKKTIDEFIYDFKLDEALLRKHFRDCFPPNLSNSRHNSGVRSA